MKSTSSKLTLNKEILKNLQSFEAARIEGGTVILIPDVRIYKPVQSQNGLSCLHACVETDLCVRPVLNSFVGLQ